MTNAGVLPSSREVNLLEQSSFSLKHALAGAICPIFHLGKYQIGFRKAAPLHLRTTIYHQK